MWGIDMIGTIEPKASNEHCFILVAIDYFTKWVEVASYANVTKYDRLNLTEEKRLTAMCHGKLYQWRMKKAFDKKVRSSVFREGDLVLKKILSFKHDVRRKWTPNYEGRYVMKRAFSGGALVFTTMDGEEFTRPMNTDAVKKYFA
ncbi:hypothetical protein KIW84_010537 [Lathyrus oleraceus]|uniref:Uncharacterized protein n=1 Tax=Pisum sativum TaxID=3888 RepID=A0A9D5BDT1_PEA|nr:hypothetical protein KIW84_010537 [Pisum sativum]